MQKSRAMRMVEAAGVALCVVQALRVLFSMLFGVIYDALFEGPFTIGAVVTIALAALVFLAPLLAPRRPPRWFALVMATLAFAARIPMTLDAPAVRLYSSLVIVAAGGLYWADLLRQEPAQFAPTLIVGLIVDQLFRAAGDTFDITLRSAWLPVQAAVSVGLAVASAIAARSRPQEEAQGGIGLWGGLAIGAFLFLETSLLALPNAAAHWSAWNYAILAPILVLTTSFPLLLHLAGEPPWLALRARLWGLFLMMMACAGLASGSAEQGLSSAVALVAAQWAVTLALLAVPMRQPLAETHSNSRTGTHLALGLLLFLSISFVHAFTFTYAYTLDLFRGMGLPTFLLAAVIATLPALARGLHLRQPSGRQVWPWALGAMAALTALTAVLARPPALRITTKGPVVRIGTYNIHYGYNAHWNLTLEQIARTIEESGADIVALQEVDTGRMTSYSVDNALWLSRRLKMGVVYLPTMEHLTGIALLHRLPLQASEGRLLTSQLEQTGIIRARLDVRGRSLDVYATWLGLKPEERATQLGEALAYVVPGPAAFAGDLNATPDSPVYSRLSQAGLVDPFVAGGFAPLPTDPAEGPSKRIDYIWLRGLSPAGAMVLESTASDHRMVVVEARLE